MSAIMVIYMKVDDNGWMEDYFANVPGLLAEYGAETIAGARNVVAIEGKMPAPDRLALLRFPSLDSIEHFMADDRYQPYKSVRQAGSRAEIFAFENAVRDRELV